MREAPPVGAAASAAEVAIGVDSDQSTEIQLKSQIAELQSQLEAETATNKRREDDLTTMTESRDALQIELDAANAINAQLQHDLTEAETQIEKLNQQLEGALTAACDSQVAEMRIETLSGELGTLKAQFEATQANELKLVSACEEFEALKASTTKMEEELAVLRSSKKLLSKKLAKLKKSSGTALEKATRQQAVLDECVKQLQAQNEQLEGNLTEAQEAMEDAKQDSIEARHLIENLQTEKNALKQEIEQLRAASEELEALRMSRAASVNDESKQREELEQQIRRLQGEGELLRVELHKKGADDEALQKIIEELHGKLEETRTAGKNESLGSISLEFLHTFDCHNESRRLLSLMGHVFDVTESEQYAEGGELATFTGHDITLCMATGSRDVQWLDRFVRLKANFKEQASQALMQYTKSFRSVGELNKWATDRRKWARLTAEELQELEGGDES